MDMCFIPHWQKKLLILLLAKLVNFVPEGGIWMNTQRPEWNDANNALVGKGLSVVTLCYLRRTLAFYKDLLQQADLKTIQLSVEVAEFPCTDFPDPEPVPGSPQRLLQ